MKYTIRDWWSEYLVVLQNGRHTIGNLERLNAITADLEQKQIIRPGYPMPTTGAEDLVQDCDRIKRMKH